MTQEEAILLFEYRDGALYWRSREDVPKNWNTKFAGKLAGSSSGHGYLKVSLANRSYYVHQIVYLMHYGFIPEVVDHIDRDTLNNSIENLRASNKSTNGMNRPAPTNNTSGAKGVRWHKGAKKWMVQIMIGKKGIYKGLYSDFEDAKNVASKAFEELHREFAHT